MLSEVPGALEELLSIERAIFKEENDQVKSRLLLDKSKLYSRLEKYNDALATLSRINTYNAKREIQFEIINQKIFLNFLLGEYNQVKNAVLEASLIDDYTADEDTKLIEILNYVALEEFDKAKELFEELNADSNSQEIFDVKKLKKEERAFNLSLVVPGSGQIYAGHFFRGLTSMGLQGVLFTYGVQGIQRRYFFTQALPSIGIFQGFYFGGAEYARELTVKRNEEIVKKLSNNIVNSFK